MIYCPHCQRLDIAAWLRSHGVKIGPALTANLEHVLLAPEPVRSVKDLPVRETTFRVRLRKKHLPPPSAWVSLARAIHAVHELQNATQERVAYRMGYADHSAVSVLVRRNFGLSAREARRTPRSTVDLLNLWWKRNGARKAGVA